MSGKIRQSRMFVLLGMLASLTVTVPAAAQTTPQDPPTVSVSDRLDDRRYVAAGSRGYIVGAETGRFGAMGSAVWPTSARCARSTTTRA